MEVGGGGGGPGRERKSESGKTLITNFINSIHIQNGSRHGYNSDTSFYLSSPQVNGINYPNGKMRPIHKQ